MIRENAVSCLMVASPSEERLPLLRRSVEAYLAQTYTPRELVVVLDQGPARPSVRDFLAALNRTDITIVEPEQELVLGALRNVSVDAACGTFACQWDDDDIYHPNRLAESLERLTKKSADALYLSDVFQLFSETRELFWTNWAHTESGGHQATVLFRRDVCSRYPEQGQHCRTHEDYEFCLQLKNRHKVAFLPGRPHLYVYVSHGHNTMSNSHHRMLADSLTLSRRLVERRRQDIATALGDLRAFPSPVRVMSREGFVFEWPEGEPDHE